MKFGRSAIVLFLSAACVLTARPASAVKTFLAEFKAVYVKKTNDRTMKIFNAAVEKDSCQLCHLAKPKKGYNAYGVQFKSLLNGKRDAHNSQKIRAAFAKVARMPSDPGDPQSPTFGERLREGKLPAGEIRVRPKSASK